MRLIDLFEAGFPTGKIRNSVKDTLPIIGVIPEIDNGNLYMNYRFGVTLASALSVANGEHAYSKQIPWHTQQTVAPYTQQELEIVKLACAQSGFTLDMLHDEVSREPDWVNTVSPVANLPMLESRRLLEAFGTQKLRPDIEATLPPVLVVPELNSGNNYPQYRFMTLMASIRAIKDGDVPYRKLQPWSNSLAVVGYTPEDIETIRMAAAEAGFAIDEINSSPSQEPDWVNTTSPVMKFRMLEAAGDGVFLEPKSPLIHNLSSADDAAQSHQRTPTRGKPQILVVYPGRFQPLHRGHKKVYDDLVKRFGPNVYLATSGKTDQDRSPFGVEDKAKMAAAAGIPSDRVVQVKNPYNPTEITGLFEPRNTVLLMAVGDKDMAEDPRFKLPQTGLAVKKDGNPAYLQRWPELHKAKTMDQHGYIVSVPTERFEVLGEPVTSATEIRKAYRAADAAKRDQIIADLYGKSLRPMRTMFDQRLGDDSLSEGQLLQFRRPDLDQRTQNFHAAKALARKLYWLQASSHFSDEEWAAEHEIEDALHKMGYTAEPDLEHPQAEQSMIITHLPSKRVYRMAEPELLGEDQEAYLQNPLDPEGDTNGPGHTGDAFEAEVWKTPNPVKNHKHLNAVDKAAAKARAKRAGRKYPNMVDNIWAAKR